MCVAIPALVISTDDSQANVEVRGNKLKVNIDLVDAKPGDYVLIHAGVALEVLDKDQATEILELFDELGEKFNENSK